MKISVITVCYNSAKTIGHTLTSVREQTFGEVEHIVVDGNSTDSTLEIVAAAGNPQLRLISERDHGIYDAMNKGIALATGDIVGFINSDDFYASPEALQIVADGFARTGADCCYGDLCYVKEDEIARTVRYWRSGDFVQGAFSNGWCPPHPTFFVRRSVYQQLGGFDLDFKIAADFELMARYLEAARISYHYIPEVLVKMRLGGTTNRNLGNIIKQNLEIRRALKKHGLSSSFSGFFIHKLLARALQFVRRPA